jgi:hypothetical protein
MKKIYISHFVLDVPSEKKELCSSQYLNLRTELSNTEIDFVKVLLILANGKWYSKFRLWITWRMKVVPLYYRSILGRFHVWFFEKVLKKDVFVTEVFSEYLENEVIEICQFLTDKKPCDIVPIERIGWFQKITDFGFEHLTVEQFIEAYRCFLMLDKLPTEALKKANLNELISYLFAPRLMWYAGTYGRLFFLKDSFKQRRILKVSVLSENEKLLLLEYYVDNLRILKEWYKNFYSGTQEKKPEADIYTQYFSMKSLIQLRSANGTLSDKIKMLEIRELIESYEVEIIQAKIKTDALK